MKMYLLKVYQSNNSLEELMSSDITRGLKENNGMLYQMSIDETKEYLVIFAFKQMCDREKMSEIMQHIRYEYEDIDYDENLLSLEKTKIKSAIYTGYETKKRKSIKFEKMIEQYFENNKNIKYDKTVLCSETNYSFIYKDKNVCGGIIISCDNRYMSFGVNGISFSMKERKITVCVIEEMFKILDEIIYENDK